MYLIIIKGIIFFVTFDCTLYHCQKKETTDAEESLNEALQFDYQVGL
jgi:hypothetical protein